MYAIGGYTNPGYFGDFEATSTFYTQSDQVTVHGFRSYGVLDSKIQQVGWPVQKHKLLKAEVAGYAIGKPQV